MQQDSFEYLPFFDDDIVVICWPGHLLEGRTAALEEIAGEVFVGMGKRQCDRPAFKKCICQKRAAAEN